MNALQAQCGAAIAALEAMREYIRTGTSHAVTLAAEAAERDARATAAFKDHTGKLRGGFRSTARGFKAKVVNRVKYAVFVNNGTAPHRIVPSSARRLRFMVGGNVVFARGVNHPGTKPTRFMEHAQTVGEAIMATGINAVIRTATQRHNA